MSACAMITTRWVCQWEAREAPLISPVIIVVFVIIVTFLYYYLTCLGGAASSRWMSLELTASR